MRTSSSLRTGSERAWEMSQYHRLCVIYLTYIVLCTEILGESGRHDFPSDRRRSREMRLSGLAP